MLTLFSRTDLRSGWRPGATAVSGVGLILLGARGAEERAAETAGGCSAGLVVVPGRLKFWSSRGPMASDAGVLLVVSGTLWANAGAAATKTADATYAIFQRKPAPISSRSVLETPSLPVQRAPLPAASSHFKHRCDEPGPNSRT